MHCYVYASIRKTDTYVWLDDPGRIGQLPESLTQLLGELRHVLDVDLTPDRILPKQDASQILDNLKNQGWHLQLPPGDDPG